VGDERTHEERGRSGWLTERLHSAWKLLVDPHSNRPRVFTASEYKRHQQYIGHEINCRESCMKLQVSTAVNIHVLVTVTTYVRVHNLTSGYEVLRRFGMETRKTKQAKFEITLNWLLRIKALILVAAPTCKVYTNLMTLPPRAIYTSFMIPVYLYGRKDISQNPQLPVFGAKTLPLNEALQQNVGDSECRYHFQYIRRNPDHFVSHLPYE
jgi:hypothetical protein